MRHDLADDEDGRPAVDLSDEIVSFNFSLSFFNRFVYPWMNYSLTFFKAKLVKHIF